MRSGLLFLLFMTALSCGPPPAPSDSESSTRDESAPRVPVEEEPVGGATGAGEGGERLVAEKRLAYQEDEISGRVVADVHARIVAEANGPRRLLVDIAAQGAEILAAPGFEGKRGHNLISAEEMTMILDHERGFISNRGRRGEAAASSLKALRRGRIPLRRRRSDGSIDLEAESEVLVVALRLEADPAGSGRRETRLNIDGKERLRIVWDNHQIYELTGLSAHTPER